MSFIRRERRGNRVYLAEVKSVRVGNKVRQQFIRYIGREADGRTILSCSISDAQVDEVRVAGPLMVLHALATQIKLPALLGDYASEILALVYAHCMDYKSLNKMPQWFERTDLNLILNLDDLTESRLLAALDSLQGFDAVELQRKLFENTKKYLRLKSQGVVYDVTNTYFHGKRCKLGRWGHDKEDRKGYPLIQIGLAVTADHGIPIFHRTFPGNIHDARTFMDVSSDLVKFGIQGGLAVMDRGTSSAENTRFLREKGWHVVCGLKRHAGIEKALGPRFHGADLDQPANRVRVQKTSFYARAQSFRHGESRGRLIACFNKRTALEMQESRLDEVEAATDRLSKGLTIKEELVDFFDKGRKPNIRRINAEGRWDGVSFIFTNSSFPVSDTIRAYFDKDVVEKSFQALKGVVKVRPIRHWLYNRVEAHVFICYLSCLLLTLLKIKVAPLELSFQEALDELAGLYRVYLRDPKGRFEINRLVSLTQQQEKILRAVDKRLVKKSPM
jgi:transposase